MPSKKDQELIAAATAAISERYRNDWQEVGAAMRTRDGRIVTGVNIDAYIGRIAVCAEAIAIGRAITETGDHGIETIVAVRHPKPGEPEGLGERGHAQVGRDAQLGGETSHADAQAGSDADRHPPPAATVSEQGARETPSRTRRFRTNGPCASVN